MEGAFRPAGKDLGHEGTALIQHVEGKMRGGLAERHDAQVVGLFVARGGSGHVAHDHIGFAAEPGLDLFIGVIGHEIELVELRTCDRFDLLQVDAQDRALRLALFLAQRIDAGHGDLAPAAGRAAEVHDAGPGYEKTVFIVDLEDFEGRAPAIAFGLGAGHVGIVELAFEPARRAELAPARGFHLHAQIALPASAAVFATGFPGHRSLPMRCRDFQLAEACANLAADYTNYSVTSETPDRVMPNLALKHHARVLLRLCTFFVVAFGQPVAAHHLKPGLNGQIDYSELLSHCGNVINGDCLQSWVTETKIAAAEIYAEIEGMCALGDAESCTRQGYLLEFGVGVEIDEAAAVARFDEGCTRGDLYGCIDLGYMHENGIGTEVDYAEAERLYLLACEARLGLGCANLAALHEFGLGVERDESEAVRLYTIACDDQIAFACTNLGFLTENGLGTEQDLAAARDLYFQACGLDDGYGCSNYGYFLQYGLAGAPDETEAREFYDRGCTLGGPLGCLNLGVMDELGQSGPVNIERAMELYERACEGGEPMGCTNLGYLLEASLPGGPNYTEAITQYQRGCDGGDGLGCSNLGVLYEYGHGTLIDMNQAALFYRQGCDMEVPVACTNLGGLFLRGEGVPRLPATAISLFENSCAVEEPFGCFMLGFVHENGVGMDQDLDRALSFYDESCTMGDQAGCDSASQMRAARP